MLPAVNTLLDRAFDVLVAHARLAIAASFALALALGLFAEPAIDTRLEIWFLDDDPDVAAYDRFLEQFESDEFAAIAVRAPDVLAPDVLERVASLGSRLQTIEGALDVTSLMTMERVESDGTVLTVRPLIESVPQSASERAALRETIADDRLVRDLIGDDGRATLLLVEHVRFTDLAEKARFAREVSRAADEVLGDIEHFAAGNAFVDATLQSHTWRDLRILAPLTVLAVILLTLLLFRDFWCTAVPTLVVGLTVASTVGFAGLFGIKLNMITTIVLPLAIAVGVADAVHLIAGYRERLARDLAPRDALRSAWIELLYPCFVTTLTTAAGLASLLAANLTPLRQFGWMGAATVGFALLYTLILIPAFFSLVRPPHGAAATAGPLGDALEWLADLGWGRHKLVLVATLGLTAFGFFGAMRLEIGADFAAYFKQDDPLFVASRYIDEELGGTGSVEVVVRAPDVREPDVLRAIERAQAALESNDAVLSTESLAVLVKTLHERYFGDVERFVIPDSLPAVAQLLSQTEGTAVHERLALADYSATRIRARIRASDYRELVASMDRVEADIQQAFDGVAEAELTGIGKLVANLDTYILRSQIRSFFLAFVSVGLLLGLFFRSVHIGIWALVPNALPIVIVLGFMGWAGILLDVGTVMVASIMLGLIVDDTVHYLARYRLERSGLTHAQRTDPEALRLAARATGLGTGRAIATTSLILACGFWVSLFASFQPNINFGMLCGAATMVALLTDLVALPAVIRAFPLRPGSE